MTNAKLTFLGEFVLVMLTNLHSNCERFTLFRAREAGSVMHRHEYGNDSPKTVVQLVTIGLRIIFPMINNWIFFLD